MNETLRWLLIFVCAPLALIMAGMALHALWPIGLPAIGIAALVPAGAAAAIIWLAP